MENGNESPSKKSMGSGANAEKVVSTHEYYTLALSLEKKLVRNNLLLTIASILAMMFQIGYGLATWNIQYHLFSYDMQLLFVEFIFFKSISAIMFIKRWLFLLKNKEASHPMNSVCMMGMFAIVAVCMLMSNPPSDSQGGVMYLVIVTMMDLALLVTSVFNI